MQLEYHRSIGIKHFAYIDNISTDGTYEYLNEQSDVSLFTVNELYNGKIKNAWVRQVTDYFGYNKWYLLVDVDELFIYPGIETKKINEYIEFLEEKKYTCSFSPMIDMYSKNILTEEKTDLDDIYNKYCYFDLDSYKKKIQLVRQRITGGPRIRLFNKNNTRSKHALIKLSKEMISGTHENHPTKYNFQANNANAFLLHYKLFSYDEKIEGTNTGSDHNRSDFLYKKYKNLSKIDIEEILSYNGTKKLNNSLDLLNINIIDKRFFKQFFKKII